MTRPVTVRGVRYASTKAAAAALGVTASTVRVARKQGRLDTVGLVAAQPPERREAVLRETLRARAKASPHNKRPMTLDDVPYATVGEAAERLGTTPSVVSSARTVAAAAGLDPDGFRTLGSGVLEGGGVAIGGRRFESRAAAERDLGVHPGQVSAFLKVAEASRAMTSGDAPHPRTHGVDPYP